MPVTLNTALKNVLLDGLDSAFNAGTLTIRTGPAPGANAAATGTVLATITLPADAFAAASGGTKAAQGTWQDASADASGTAQHFRLVSGAGTLVLEGTVTATGVGGDLELDNTSVASGQQVTITAFTLSSSN
jgi:hypothetical protein